MDVVRGAFWFGAISSSTGYRHSCRDLQLFMFLAPTFLVRVHTTFEGTNKTRDSSKIGSKCLFFFFSPNSDVCPGRGLDTNWSLPF